MLKIVKSQNEDTKLAIEQFSEAIDNIEVIRSQLVICETLAKQQAEEIIALKKKAKAVNRVRIGSICVIGTGAILGITGYVLSIDKSTENIGKLLMTSGVTAIGAGGLTLSLSFTIPF